MAPKPKPWDQVKRAGLASRRMAFKSMSATSAFNTLTQRNLENTTAGYVRRMGAEAAAAAMADERENPAAKLNPPKKKGTAAVKKTKVEKPKKITKTRKRAKRIVAQEDENDDEQENEKTTEAWRPYGGESIGLHPEKTAVLGIARIAGWQFENFKTGVKELFEPFDDGDLLIEGDEIDGGGERLVDVKVAWPDAVTAEMVKDTIEPAVVMGRKVQITYVKD